MQRMVFVKVVNIRNLSPGWRGFTQPLFGIAKVKCNDAIKMVWVGVVLLQTPLGWSSADSKRSGIFPSLYSPGEASKMTLAAHPSFSFSLILLSMVYSS